MDAKLNAIISAISGIDVIVKVCSERYDWIYFNPDSAAGGQLVYVSFTKEDLLKALGTVNNAKDVFIEHISSYCDTTLIDIIDDEFETDCQELDVLKETAIFFGPTNYEKMLFNILLDII